MIQEESRTENSLEKNNDTSTEQEPLTFSDFLLLGVFGILLLIGIGVVSYIATLFIYNSTPSAEFIPIFIVVFIFGIVMFISGLSLRFLLMVIEAFAS